MDCNALADAVYLVVSMLTMHVLRIVGRPESQWESTGIRIWFYPPLPFLAGLSRWSCSLRDEFLTKFEGTFSQIEVAWGASREHLRVHWDWSIHCWAFGQCSSQLYIQFHMQHWQPHRRKWNHAYASDSAWVLWHRSRKLHPHTLGLRCSVPFTNIPFLTSMRYIIATWTFVCIFHSFLFRLWKKAALKERLEEIERSNGVAAEWLHALQQLAENIKGADKYQRLIVLFHFYGKAIKVC